MRLSSLLALGFTATASANVVPQTHQVVDIESAIANQKAVAVQKGFGDPADNPDVRGGIYFYMDSQKPNCTSDARSLWLKGFECYGPMKYDFSIVNLKDGDPHRCKAFIHTKAFCDNREVGILQPGTCYFGSQVADKNYTISIQCYGDPAPPGVTLPTLPSSSPPRA